MRMMKKKGSDNSIAIARMNDIKEVYIEWCSTYSFLRPITDQLEIAKYIQKVKVKHIRVARYNIIASSFRCMRWMIDAHTFDVIALVLQDIPGSL